MRYFPILKAVRFKKDMSQWVREGKVRYKEDIVEGLENAVGAFKRLFTGQNFGKLLVQVGPAPKRPIAHAGSAGARSGS